MDDVRSRDLKDLISLLFFLLNRQNFHLHQIATEEKRFRYSVMHSGTMSKKVAHVRHIRDFQQLLVENSRQIQIHHELLQQFLDLNDDLKGTTLYQQAGGVLKETLFLLK